MTHPLRVFTWHVHGSYLYNLCHARCEFVVPYDDARSEAYCGRTRSYPWPANLREVPVEKVRDERFDCILFQARRNWERDQHEILAPEQRRLPKIYLEHDPALQHPTDQKHWVDDPDVLLVHVTHFNNLMWDAGRTPTRVIEHGVAVPDDAKYSGELGRGAVVVNNIARRGRRLGFDLFRRASNEVPLDLVGMGWREAGGVGEVAHPELFRFVGERRFFFNPIRYTSLGLSIIEAMMIGAPIVALATTELASVVRDGDDAIVSTDLWRLIDDMRRLLGDRPEAARIGERGRRTARERFDIRRFASDWERTVAEAAS